MPQSSVLISTFAARLRVLRQQRGLSQERLAELCGLHRTYVGSAERGERDVTLRSLEAFAAALNVPAIELLRAEPAS